VHQDAELIRKLEQSLHAVVPNLRVDRRADPLPRGTKLRTNELDISEGSVFCSLLGQLNAVTPGSLVKS
jgi:hypothetical protein